MTCEGCSGAVQRVLGKLKGINESILEILQTFTLAFPFLDKGVEDIDISLENQSVKVKTTLSHEEILEHIKKTGKDSHYVRSY